MIEVIRYRLPSYWACPLINDDYTGLTDEECEEIQRFLEAAEGYPVDVDWGTQGFYRCNDAGTLPGGGSEKEGQVFCDMITECIEKYEQRGLYSRGKLNN